MNEVKLESGQLWRLSPAVGFAYDVLVNKIKIVKVISNEKVFVTPYRLEGGDEMPSTTMLTAELTKWVNDGIMAPLFIEDHQKYVVAECFDIPDSGTDDLHKLNEGNIIETTTKFEDRFGDIQIDCYIFAEAKSAEYERMVRFRKDHLERMIDSGKLKKYITSVVKDINVEVDQEFVVQRDIENTRFKRGDDIIVRALNSEYIYVESKDACEKLDAGFFKSLITSKAIINKGKFDVLIKLPATDRTIKHTFCVVREPKVGQEYVFMCNRFTDTFKEYKKGDIITINRILGDMVDFKCGDREASRVTLDYFKDMICDKVIALKTVALGAQKGEEILKYEQVYKVVNRAWGCTLSLIDFNLPENTEITIDADLNSEEEFDFGIGGKIRLPKEYIEQALLNGALELVRNPYGPPDTDGSFDRKNKVSCAVAYVKAEPGQVYEFTKDCVFFDDISGDYKAHTIKEGTTLTVGDDLCTKEGFEISAKHPVHLSYSWILNAIVKGDIRLKFTHANTCYDSRIKEGQVYRATQQVPHNMDAEEILFKKGCKVKILRARGEHVSIRVDDEKDPREFYTDSFAYWINKGILVLDDGCADSGKSPEFKNGMKFKFAKAFKNFAHIPGNDFNPW